MEHWHPTNNCYSSDAAKIFKKQVRREPLVTVFFSGPFILQVVSLQVYFVIIVVLFSYANVKVLFHYFRKFKHSTP